MDAGRTVRYALIRLTMMAVMLLVLVLGSVPNTALAHTKLTGSSPGSGDVLEQPPAEIHLTFSGKLEAAAAMHSIQLSGPDGEKLATGTPELSSDSRSFMAGLPTLTEGKYTVTYRVVSSDGHPIEGSFSFQVSPQETGPPAPVEVPPEGTEAPQPQPEPQPEPQLPQPPETEHAEHEQETPVGGTTSTFFAMLLYASRILYYGAMLPLVGWALWSCLQRMNEERLTYWRSVGFRLQLAHLVTFVLFVALHWMELTNGNAAVSLLEVLRSTGVGQSWLFTGLLSLAGLPLLFRYRFVDGAWVIGFIAAKTLRGHSGAFEPVALTRVADAVHVTGAALWVGGLLAIVLLARKSDVWFRSFAPAFSGAALLSFAVLAVTGAMLTVVYTEQLSDLFETLWGTLLIGKVVLAVGVLPIAAGLRRKLRAAEHNPEAFRKWLRVDLMLMAGIIAITGVFTHVSPVPERVPFYFHVMGQTVHMTAEIDSVRSGVNDVTVTVWVPEGEGVSSVSIEAKNGALTESSAKLLQAEVPTEEWEYFPGFDKYSFAGKLEITNVEQTSLVVHVRRQTGEVHDYEKSLID